MAGVGTKSVSTLAEGFEVPKTVLKKCANMLKKQILLEAKKDFAKMGISTRDLEKKFEVTVDSSGMINVESSMFIDQEGDGRKSGRMKWLTQDFKKKSINSFDLTPGEKKLKVTKGDREGRERLVVPMRDSKTGKLIFRTAPLHVGQSWVHPGIARGAFLQVAVHKAIEKMGPLIAEELLAALSGGEISK